MLSLSKHEGPSTPCRPLSRPLAPRHGGIRLAIMGGDNRIWFLFGGLWLLIGVLFVVGSLGVMLFVDPAKINPDMPIWAFTLVGLVTCAGGGFILVRARAAAQHDKRLMETGKPFSATVVEISRSLISVNRQPRWHVVYRYQDGGSTLQGKSRMLTADAVEDFKPGDRVNIKIDPQKPEDSLFLGKE